MKQLNYNFSEVTIIDLLEKSLIDNETKIALVFNNEQLTYQELNARANKIAFFLIANGVTPETLVPICLDSGIEMITGIIGIIKAGAAYIPIDPDYPEYRIKYILNDCGAKIVVTTNSCRSKFESLIAAENIIELDGDFIQEPAYASQKPAVNPRPENLAYVMYTSGTTGVPNGVMIEHRSVVNNLLWARNYFETGANDIILQKTNFCFDVSVWEIFWPLISGSTLVIINKEAYKNLQSLKEVITLHKVTSIHFVPTMLEFFLLSLADGECASLNRVISSGEALTRYQANLLHHKIPGAKLYNLYGPTETTIHSSFWQVPYYNNEIEKILIGEPIDHTEILILNEQNQVQPRGITGEICIGGVGLARGYLNNPNLTLNKFITHPSATRLYKTGDIGRYLNDGKIEYLGRIDDQVKINGYRIELESIEANIRNSGIVKQAVVLTRKNVSSGARIIAFVVIKKNSSVREIWDYLVTKLPGYMLPTSIKEIENIPFTSNGKVDKNQLLAAALNEAANDKIIEPVTEAGNKVMRVWKELFKNDRLSIHSNFFDLGGNSIMAMQMLSLLKKETGTHISFLLLSQFPTIQSLSKLLYKEDMPKAPNVLVSINSEGNKPPVYLVNGGGLVADGFFKLGDVLDRNQPVYGFQSDGYDENGKLFENIPDIAALYVKSILNHDSDGPYCLAGYSLGAIISFEMAKQLKAMGKEVKLLAVIDGLTRDPALIKTNYSPITVIKIVGLNIYLLRYGVSNAIKFGYGLVIAAIKNIKKIGAARPGITEKNDHDKDYAFDVFGIQIAAYKKYNLTPYDGNIIVFRAKRITFYMDDYKYLGWKAYAKNIKSITIKGDHYSIFDDQNIREFGEKLQRVLDDGF